MKFSVSKDEQIRAIFLKSDIGYDNWSERNLGIANDELYKYEFNDIFNITENEVYDYIKKMDGAI